MILSRVKKAGANLRLETVVVVLAVTLQTAALRRAQGEDRLDFKYMWYKEDNGRMQISTPSFMLETDLSPTLTLKIQGVYDSISGASPTGAPPIRNSLTGGPVSSGSSITTIGSPTTATAPSTPISIPAPQYYNDDGNEGGGDRSIHFSNGRLLAPPASKMLTLSPRSVAGFHAKAGASTIAVTPPTPAPKPTPTPATANSGGGQSSASPQAASQPATVPAPQNTKPGSNPSTLPMANVEDERESVNISLTKTIEDHAITGGLAYSTEQDYESIAASLNDAISFNQKNTTLSLGAALTHDSVENFEKNKEWDSKNTIDGFVGLTQILDPQTLFNVSLTLSHCSGYLNDQYKVVLLNGAIAHEQRPDTKDKVAALMSLTHMFKDLNGTAELSYRLYDDTYGIIGNTVQLDWFQKLGSQFILHPLIRYYQQTAANFYDVSFSGSPQNYSSDYRLSALQSIGYGLILTWQPAPSWALDAGIERYEMSGRDNKTDPQAYPSATIISAGARWWF